jgi:hypothetical protein
VAASILVAVGCGTNVPRAVVGPWQPVPLALPGTLVDDVDQTCRGSFPEFPQEARLVVIDARGAGKIEAQYAGPKRVTAACWGMTIDATGAVAGGGGGTGFGETEWDPLPATEIEQLGGYGSAEASATSGRVGRGIARVLIALPGCPPITASLADGWYLAWWPGEWPVGTKVLGLDALGQTVIEVPIDAAPPAEAAVQGCFGARIGPTSRPAADASMSWSSRRTRVSGRLELTTQ